MNRKTFAATFMVLTLAGLLAASALLAANSVIVPAWPQGKSVRVPLLMYHHVNGIVPHMDREERALTVPVGEFTSQLDWLKTAGAHVLTLSQVYWLVVSGQPLPEHPVVLTFDDGYEDNYRNVFPLLAQRGFVATFDVVSGTLDEPGHLTRIQVRALADSGNEIASHTVSHPDLRTLQGARLVHEVKDSKQALEDIAGRQIWTFCYPCGDENGRVERTAREAGYKMALTTRFGVTLSSSHLYELPRVRVAAGTQLARILPMLWGGHDTTQVHHRVHHHTEDSDWSPF
jgi:peptidoglycan/xylan/chitin deacetylase (PgdA/CDA1 family)